jgi:PAS domain S-box-containing protein
MTHKRTQNKGKPALREVAKQSQEQKDLKGLSQLDEDRLKILNHELEVHQIELLMQNEELREARVIAEEAVKKYSELYDFAPFGYYTLSSSGQILEMNLTGAQMLGKERSHLKKSMFIFFISSETRHIFNDFLFKVTNSDIKQFCEVILVTADGKCRNVQIAGININDRKECLINVSDITNLKLAEKAVIESQRLAAIGEMASSITHDFNNSLQIITGNLELLMLNRELPEPVHKYLNTIQTTLSDTAQRIMVLQRFGGKEEGPRQFFFENLNDIINEVILQIHPLWKDDAERRGLIFRIKTALVDAPEVYCNKGELRIVLYNILKNSVEAMPRGGEIVIETETINQGLFIYITDNGTGMNEESKLRIFQPFYSTKGLDIGRGLGMVSALAIVKEHGGNIRVKSTIPGKGTTIEVYLPIVQKKVAPVKEKPQKVPDTKKSIHVLWVEDEDAINTIAEEMTKILGHKIDTVHSGIEAMDRLGRNNYDVVVTDIGMPVMNGWELADRIREKFGNKLKVVVASGWGNQISEAEKTKHKIDYTIDKPFNFSQLKKILEKVKNGD